MTANIKHDSWVIWLTSGFVLLTVVVFAFALVRHRGRRDESIAALDIPEYQPAPTRSGEFRVVRVVDGDTITLVGSDGLELAVRLRGIDAPELGQPHGYEAKVALQHLIQSSIVTLDNPKKEKYGRFLANVFVGELFVNKAMIQNGDAWCDQVNTCDRSLFTNESEAKNAGRGLWATPEPTPPWVWRAAAK